MPSKKNKTTIEKEKEDAISQRLGTAENSENTRPEESHVDSKKM